MAETPEKPAYDDQEIIKNALEFHGYSMRRFSKTIEEETRDMKALSVQGPWPEAELSARGAFGAVENPRPHGHTDIISPYNNRIVNQARMNPRGVDVIPKGDGSDKKTAEMRENRIRGISYESRASQARLTALQNAVDRGRGYYRVDTDFESPRSRNLKIVVKRIPNPSSVVDDPDCQEADRSDRKQLIHGQWILNADAKRRWPNLKEPTSFTAAEKEAGASWLRPDSMYYAEYWRVEEKAETVYFFGDSPDGCFESELDKKGLKAEEAASSRKGTSRKVVKYLTNGFQVFEREDWPGSWIPFPTIVGKEKYEGDELVIESLTRKLREPQLNFDVSVAGEMEQFGMSTKSKVMVSDRAIEGYEAQWKLAHRNPQAYLVYHERDQEGQPVQQPREIAFQAQIEGYEVARNSFIRDAQNAAGMTGVDQKQRQSESGVAQDKIDAAADTNNFHFMDSYLQAIEFEGRIENELLTIIEDSARTVGFQTRNGKYLTSKIEPVEGKHPYGPPDSHGVTISTGPDSVSQMQEAKLFAETMAREPEMMANPLAPLIIELKQLGPTGDKMVKVATALQPPNVQAAYAEDAAEGQEPLPPEAIAQINQVKEAAQAINAQAEQLQQKVIELEDEKQAKVVDNAAKLEIEREKARLDFEAKWKLQQDEQEFELLKLSKEIELEKVRNDGKMLMQQRDLQHKADEGDMDRATSMISQDKDISAAEKAAKSESKES